MKIGESNPLFTWADKLRTLRSHKAALEEELKRVNADIGNAEFHLCSVMKEGKMTSFNHDGNTFVYTRDTRTSIPAEMKEDLLQVLRDQGYGDIVTENVHPSTLNSFVKERMEENDGLVPDWLGDLVSVTVLDKISVRKAH